MYFKLLHARLVDQLRTRVKSGELTERGLARLAGISQPHLHNVLKGVRVLSLATADAVAANLHWNADLPAQHDFRRREVPLAAGLLGPQHPFPDFDKSMSSLAFPVSDLEGWERPVAVRLAGDPNAPDNFRAGDVVLMELLPAVGFPGFQAGAFYVIEQEGHGLVRCYKPGLSGAESDSNGRTADPVQGARACGSERGTICAQVIWIGRFLQARPNRAPSFSG